MFVALGKNNCDTNKLFDSRNLVRRYGASAVMAQYFQRYRHERGSYQIRSMVSATIYILHRSVTNGHSTHSIREIQTSPRHPYAATFYTLFRAM